MIAGPALRPLLVLLAFCAVFFCLPALSQEVANVPQILGYHRLEGHIDSWTALGIVSISVLLAIALNHSAPAVRTSGTVLAALGCLGVTAWFAVVHGTGIISEPKPPVLPTNRFNSAILWGIAAVSLVAGLFLLRIAVWQSRRTDQLALPLENTNEKYGRVSRYLHWITAILFVLLIPMGLFTSIIPEDVTWRQGYYVVHKTIGFTVMILVLARLAWHVRSSTPPLDGSIRPWERRSAKVAHCLLYFMMLAFPISGFVMSTYGGMVSHFFIWDTPLWWGRDMEAIKPFGMFHKVILPYLSLIVIGAHVIGAIKHQLLDKHRDSIHRMVS